MGKDKDTSKSQKDERDVDTLERNFHKLREDYKSSRNQWISLIIAGTSVLIFIVVFFFQFGLSFDSNGIDTLTERLSSKDFLNNQFASILSLSISAALTLPIVYSIARVLQTQKRNATLSSLGLQIRHQRSKITLEKQAAIFGDKHHTNVFLLNELRRFLDFLDQVELLGSAYPDFNNKKPPLSPEIQNKIDMLSNDIQDYHMSNRPKYLETLDQVMLSQLDGIYTSLDTVINEVRDRNISFPDVVQLKESIRDLRNRIYGINKGFT